MKLNQDRNFDDLSARFERNLYGGPKGRLRLELVKKALAEDCAAIRSGRSLRVLDVGCGLGQVSQWLAELGHEIIAADISSVIIARAEERIAQENKQALTRIQFIRSPLQELKSQVSGSFDLVVFHAVLEWMGEPELALLNIKDWLNPEGELSLMFYNRNSLLFKNLLRGDFRRIDEENFSGDGGGLTPSTALDINIVEQWVKANGFECVKKRGIRSFSDYMPQALDRRKPPTATEQEILRMEWKFSDISPFRELARYQLWHCARTTNS